MENVFFGIAVASFILAAVCAVACVVVFVKLGVLDAIRFLRHRTVASGVGLVGVLAHKPKERKAKAEDLDRDTAPSFARKKGKHERGAGKRNDPDSKTDDIQQQKEPDSKTIILTGDDEADSDTDCLGGKGPTPENRPVKEPEFENPTDLLAQEDTERPTDLLAEEGSENPTSLLTDEASENPTDLLVEEDSESPTGLLVAEEEDSESPTGLLVAEEDSENPTELLAANESIGDGSADDGSAIDEPAGSQTSCLATPEEEDEIIPAHTEEETVFRFQIKQSQMVVHTEEVIE